MTDEQILAAKIEAIGVGYSRMEQCVMDLVKAIHLLVEQNATLLQALSQEGDDPEDESPGYLSLKRR